MVVRNIEDICWKFLQHDLKVTNETEGIKWDKLFDKPRTGWS